MERDKHNQSPYKLDLTKFLARCPKFVVTSLFCGFFDFRQVTVVDFREENLILRTVHAGNPQTYIVFLSIFHNPKNLSQKFECDSNNIEKGLPFSLAYINSTQRTRQDGKCHERGCVVYNTVGYRKDRECYKINH